MKNRLFRLANKLYDHCYPVYHPLYSAWKAVSDRKERALLRQVIQPGAMVVDVGANIGIYTRFFSDLAKSTGRVHAFEPAPSNFKRLQQNCGALPNVSLNHAAVGDRNGDVRLYVSSELNVDHRTFDSGDGREWVDVLLVSLDSHFSAGQHVDLIKIDVQGYELSVLHGARRVLTENHGVRILMEYWPYGLTRAKVSPAAVLEFMISLGFEIRTTTDPEGSFFDGSGLDPENIDHYCNLIVSRSPV